MVTATRPTTIQAQPKERLSEPSQPELNEERLIPATESVIRGGEHQLSGRVAHSVVSFYDWMSGPPSTKLERNRAEMAYVKRFRHPRGIIV